ncbi:MAG: hypothetical protein U0900_20260 [Myxococcota bacterium]
MADRRASQPPTVVPLRSDRGAAVPTSRPALARSARVRLRLRGRALALSVVLPLALAACRDPDRAILAGLPEADQARFLRGRTVAVPCWTCHDLAGRVVKVGPSLQGVFGRRSGMAPGQPGSDAMLAAAIVWDERSLAAFLSNPAGFVPGNRMVSPGVADPGALADLLFYLRRVSEPGAREQER